MFTTKTCQSFKMSKLVNDRWKTNEQWERLSQLKEEHKKAVSEFMEMEQDNYHLHLELQECIELNRRMERDLEYYKMRAEMLQHDVNKLHQQMTELLNRNAPTYGPNRPMIGTTDNTKGENIDGNF